MGPCCSKCGGGNACPPDWYTLQGVRVLSRSKPRNLSLSEQAPREGTFGFTADPTNPNSPYYVVNNLPLPFTLTSTEIISVTPPASATTGLNAQPNPTAPVEVLNTKQLGLDVAPGYEVTIGHYFCRDTNNNDHFIEFTFWGLNSWSFSKYLNGYMVPIYDTGIPYTPLAPQTMFAGQQVPIQSGQFEGSLRTPYPLAGTTDFPGSSDQQKTLSLAFNYGTDQSYTYRSSMNNFEIDGRINPRGEPDRLVLHPDGQWRRECQPGTYMSYLYGLRFMEIDESFAFNSKGTGPYANDATIPVQDAAGNYDVATHNSLLGLQIGADMTFRNCKWTWGVESKFGVLPQHRQSSQQHRRRRPRWDAPLSLQFGVFGQLGYGFPDRRGGFSSYLQVPAKPDGPRIVGLHVDYGRRPGAGATPVRSQPDCQGQPQRHHLLARPVARIGMDVVTRARRLASRRGQGFLAGRRLLSPFS